MTSEIAHEGNVVIAEHWATDIAEQAVSLISEATPYASRRTLANEFAARMLQEKAAHNRRGIGHWQEHAASVANRLLKQVLTRARRNAELTDFIERGHEGALSFARTFLELEEDAVDALAETYAKLLTGKTKTRYFYRALKQTILDKLKRSKNETKLFESLGTVLQSSTCETSAQTEYGNSPTRSLDLMSHHEEDQDPLDILMRREEVLEGIRLVVSDRNRHAVMHRKWWKDLVENTPGTTALLRK